MKKIYLYAYKLLINDCSWRVLNFFQILNTNCTTVEKQPINIIINK